MGCEREHRRNGADGWLALTGLVGAGLALPLEPGAWHGPEFAAILAVSAIALLAGQRWAIAAIVLAELCLLPTVWPRAVLEHGLSSRLIAFATLTAIVPGVRAMPRAAAALVGVTGRGHTEQRCRRTHIGLVLLSVVAVLAPLLRSGREPARMARRVAASMRAQTSMARSEESAPRATDTRPASGHLSHRGLGSMARDRR